MERIVIRDANGNLIAKDGGRVPGRRYSDHSRDPDGTVVLLEWTPERETMRDAEEAAFTANKDKPGPKSREDILEERLAALEAKRAAATKAI